MVGALCYVGANAAMAGFLAFVENLAEEQGTRQEDYIIPASLAD